MPNSKEIKEVKEERGILRITLEPAVFKVIKDAAEELGLEPYEYAKLMIGKHARDLLEKKKRPGD